MKGILHTRKIRKLFFFFFCLITLCILCWLLFSLRESFSEIDPADDIFELQVGVNYYGHWEKIKLWYEPEEDVYYYFLPSGSNNTELCFVNAPEDSVSIDGSSITKSHNLNSLENIYDSMHELKFINDGKEENISVYFLCSDNISSIFIDMDTDAYEEIKEDKKRKEKAHLYAVDEIGKINFDGDLDFIKCRGVSSFMYCEKKQYTIKFDDDISFLNMPKSEKWVLQGNAYDNSKVKNKVAYDYALMYSDVCASQSKYADVYVNGDYIGNYLVCQHKAEIVKMDEPSNLSKKNKEANKNTDLSSAKPYESQDGKIKAYTNLNNPQDITGGYLIEANGSLDADCSFVTDSGVYYEVLYPEYATREEVEYICNYMNELENALKDPSGYNSETGKYYTDYIDVNTWAQKVAMDQLFGDKDKTMLQSETRSLFFYKYSNEVDAHIFSAVTWDYDSAFGESIWAHDVIYLDNPNLEDGEGSLYGKFLFSKQEFKENISKYLYNVAKVWVEDDMSKYLRDISNSIGASLRMDLLRWPIKDGRYSELESNWNYIRWFLSERVKYLEDVWVNGEEYHTITFLGPNEEVVERYKVKDGDPITKVPSVTSYEGVFAGWRFANDKLFRQGMLALEDTTIKSLWYNVELFSLNILGNEGVSFEDIDVNALRALAEEIEKKQKEDEKLDEKR